LKDMPEQSFITWVAYMYQENCREREAFGQKPFESAKAYLKKNRGFLEREYRKKKNLI